MHKNYGGITNIKLKHKVPKKISNPH